MYGLLGERLEKQNVLCHFLIGQDTSGGDLYVLFANFLGFNSFLVFCQFCIEIEFSEPGFSKQAHALFIQECFFAL